jgi:hypothetical protein
MQQQILALPGDGQRMEVAADASLSPLRIRFLLFPLVLETLELELSQRLVSGSAVDTDDG